MQLTAGTPTGLVIVAALTMTGCRGSASECDGNSSCEQPRACAAIDQGSVRENASPQIARVSEAGADATLVVTNVSRAAERVVVRADGKLLLDGLLPPGSDYCGHQPVFSWSYDLPERAVTVAVTAAGQDVAIVVDARGPRRWVTVMTQDRFPLYVKATDTAPGFG